MLIEGDSFPEDAEKNLRGISGVSHLHARHRELKHRVKSGEPHAVIFGCFWAGAAWAFARRVRAEDATCTL